MTKNEVLNYLDDVLTELARPTFKQHRLLQMTKHNNKKKSFCMSSMVSIGETKKNLKKFQKEFCKIIQGELF